MPLNPLERMLETMMAHFFNPDQKSTGVCCHCYKAKKPQGQQLSHTSCKCKIHRNKNSPKKPKKRCRKLKNSCLRTIVCVAKMAKDGGECLDCACHRGGENPTDGAVDERYCSKCGQLLPGAKPEDQPSIELEKCHKQLENCRQELNKTKNIEFTSENKHTVDMGVQVNVEKKEPMTVRIKVCPCPNKTNSHGHVNQSRSEPDMSRANISYDGDETSDMYRTRGPLEQGDYEYGVQTQPQSPHTVGLNELSNDFPADIARMKMLALNMAKARLVQDTASWERGYAARMLRQRQTSLRGSEEAGEASEAFVNSRKSVIPDDDPGVLLRPHFTEDEPAGQPTGDKTRKSRTTNPWTNGYNAPPNADIWDQSIGPANYGQYNFSGQNMSTTCCNETGVYCYNPDDSSQYGDHCKNSCSCSNNAQFVPYQQFTGPNVGYSQPQQPSDHTNAHCDEHGVWNPYSFSTRHSGWSPCQ